MARGWMEYSGVHVSPCGIQCCSGQEHRDTVKSQCDMGTFVIT